MNYMSNFKDSLKELLKDEEIKPSELARRTKISKGLISNYLTGVTCPTVKNLVKLADYFKVSCDYLLGLTYDDNYVNKNNSKKFEQIILPLILKKYKSIREFEKENELTYNNWRGNSFPYIDTLIKLSEIFGVSVDYLLGRDN